MKNELENEFGTMYFTSRIVRYQLSSVVPSPHKKVVSSQGQSPTRIVLLYVNVLIRPCISPSNRTETPPLP